MEERRLSSRAVPAWHFTMLADHARNDAYRRAIEKVVGPGDVVLDIGTGAGLPALFAARAGARHVHTCEMSGALAAVAREVMVDNGYADRVTVHHKRSTALRVGAGRDADLPGHADVLVSEILDAGLLGEGHAPSIRHARAHLLKPGARIIPAAATLWALPMEAPRRPPNPFGTSRGSTCRVWRRIAIGATSPERCRPYPIAHSRPPSASLGSISPIHHGRDGRRGPRSMQRVPAPCTPSRYGTICIWTTRSPFRPAPMENAVTGRRRYASSPAR